MDFVRYALLSAMERGADLEEAGAIVDGRTKLIPERRHLLALALLCERLERRREAS